MGSVSTGKGRWWLRLVVAVCVVGLLAGCGPTAAPEPAKPAPAPAAPAPAPAPKPEQPKEIVSVRDQVTIGMSQEPRGFGMLVAQIASLQVEAAMNLGLAVRDNELVMHPGLAEALPSQAAGTWKLNADGTMETVWKIRPGIKWHDGVELTADDFVFAWQVAVDPDIPVPQREIPMLITDVTAVDRYTFRVTWKQFWPFAEEAVGTGTSASTPLPKHLLEKVYQEDKEKFINHPYWTKEFIGTGPYVLKEWVEGSHIVLEANPDYIFGPPKIKTVVYRFIPDTNTLVSNIMSGEVDVTITPTVGLDHAATLKEKWSDGTAITIPGFGWDWVVLQQDDPKLRDVRVRKALMHAMDRAGIVTNLFGGAFTVAHTPALSDRHPWFDTQIDDSSVRYEYDMAAAEALMKEAGWTKGADGLLRNAQGQKFELSFRTVAGDKTKERAQAVIQESWTKLGLDITIDNKASNLIYDREHLFKLAWPGAFLFNFGGNPRTVPRYYHSKFIPSEANNWSGSNLGQYSNSRADELVLAIDVCADPAERTKLLAELMRLVTDEVAMIPLWYKADVATIKSGLENVLPTGTNDPWTWNINEWYWSK